MEATSERKLTLQDPGVRVSRVQTGTVRVGVIGLGDIAVRAHVPAILREPLAELVAVSDVDEARLERRAPEGPAGRRLPGRCSRIRASTR